MNYPMNPLLNAEQVATLLGCSIKTVEAQARLGSIPGTKFGDGWIFCAELVIDAVKTISLKEAAERTKPQHKAKGIKVTENDKGKPPGMKHMSQEAIREVLSAKRSVA
jgi:hypothetical protein